MPPEIRINGQPIAVHREGETSAESATGMIGVELRVNPDNRINEVVLGTIDCLRLRGAASKLERVIQLGADGIGSQQISQTETLEYDLGRRIRPVPRMIREQHDSHNMGDPMGATHRTKNVWIGVY